MCASVKRGVKVWVIGFILTAPHKTRSVYRRYLSSEAGKGKIGKETAGTHQAYASGLLKKLKVLLEI